MRTSLFISTIVVSLISFVANAQELKTTKVTIGGSETAWMDAYAVGDSVLIHYMHYSANIEMKKAVWVMPDGTSKFVELDTEIFSVNSYGTDVYYYVLEEIKKKLYLTAIVDRPDGTRTESKESINIEGDVLDGFIDKNQFILLYNRKAKKMIELELNKMQVVNRREWILPDAIVKQIGKTAFTFIKDGSFANSFIGSGKVKLYRKNDGNYLITVDERHGTRPNKPITRDNTTGTHIAVMGDTAVKAIPFIGSNEFRSSYMDGKLFRYSLARSMATLEVLDVASGQLIDRHIPASNTNFPVYVRDGVRREVTQNGSYQSILKVAGRSDPSIAVYSNSDGTYTIMTGCKIVQDQANGYVGVGIAFGLTGVLIYTALNGMHQAADSRGIDAYYYTTFDPASAKLQSQLTDDKYVIRTVIDQFEMSTFDNQRKIDMRGYSETGKYLVSFYYILAPKTVMVAWFPRSK